jgi:hypothetical protein
MKTTTTTTANKPARKVRKPAVRKPAAGKSAAGKPAAGLKGLTKEEQRKAIDKAMKGKTIIKVPASKLFYNKAGYNAITSGYRGAYTIAAFKALGLIAITGTLVTKGKDAVFSSQMRGLLTDTAVTTWTSKNGYAVKGKDGKWSLTVKGINNLSGRMDKLHAGRALTSYGVDGIVDAKKALKEMLAFITRGTRSKDNPDMVPVKVSDK